MARTRRPTPRIYPLWYQLYAIGSRHSSLAHPYRVITERIVSVVLLSTYGVEWV